MTTTTTGPAGDQQDQTQPNPAELEQATTATDTDEPLGPAGVRALEAEKTRRREEATKRREEATARQAAEAEVARLREQLAKGTGTPAGDQQGPDLEKLRSDAERAAMTRANERIVAAELRAAATGKLTDPTDAVTFLARELGTVEVAGDGAVDTQQIADMLEDLLARKPHLAVQTAAPQRFGGSANGGPRTPVEPKTLHQEIADAEVAGNTALAMQLKTRLLLSPTTPTQ